MPTTYDGILLDQGGGVFNVKSSAYGATGDGTTDDTSAISSALAAASSAGGAGQGGATVYLPAGEYLVSGSLTIPEGVNFVGDGWNAPGTSHAGTWLKVSSSASYGNGLLNVTGNGAAIRRLAFNVYDQSTTSNPPANSPMIYINADNVLVEDVMLFNPYAGIQLASYAHMVLRRVVGQPLNVGITIDGSEDTNFIDTIHFWFYWSASSTIKTYMKANARGIELFRCDNPHLSNITTIGYFKGLTCSQSTAGIPHKVHLTNADFDECVYGITVELTSGSASNLTSLQLSNVTINWPTGTGVTEGNGIWVKGGSGYTKLQAVNLRITNTYGSAINVAASDVNFALENVSIEDWGSGGGTPAGIAINGTSTTGYLGIGRWFTGGPSGAADYSPTSQFVVD